jgi:H+-transporting ATPase
VLLTPGLSVIIDAIKESRKIFQRMMNYAIYRISETVALLGFLTLAILLFKMYPVTAIMIVLLAILNDGAILSIAYDNVRHRNEPQTWDMHRVLGVATVLGLFAMVRSFGILYIGDTIFHLSNDTLRTLVYLNLSVGGHLTLFAARTRGPFWSIRPAPILLVAVVGTQLAATLIAVHGLLMAPLGWTYAGIVWGYCLVLFLIQDRIKLLGYRVFSRQHTGFLVKQAKK